MTAVLLALALAPVTHVTVYADRARVVRTAHVTLDGSDTVEFPLLPEAVDPATIRVETAAELSRVDIEHVGADAYPQARARELLSALDALDDDLARARGQRAAYAAALEVLDKLEPKAPEANAMRPPPRLDPSGWSAALAFVRSYGADVRRKLREIDRKITELSEKRQRVAVEATLLGGARAQSGHRVTAHLSGHGPATVRLVYFTGAAAWRPTYELRLEPKSGQLEVRLFGLVSQKTTEDWVDAQLLLSTAAPATATQFPKLLTWKIGERERFVPTPVAQARQPPAAPKAVSEPRIDQPEDTLAILRERLGVGKEVAQPVATEGRVITKDYVQNVPVSRNFDSVAQVAPGAQADKRVAISGQTRPASGSSITGRVTDAATGQALPGVTVVAQGPAGEQAEITDESGNYTIAGLTPGTYVVRMFYANTKVERQNVNVSSQGTAQVSAPLQTRVATAETYTITEKAPTVDVGSTKIGTTISTGVPFAGGTSGENRYQVDGANATEELGIRPPPAYQPPVTLAGGWDLRFPVAGKDTVRSGAGARKVPLLSRSWPVAVERKIFPALGPDAFLVAEMRNPTAQALPPGPATLFVGSDPAGDAQLALMSPGEAVTLPLGLDRALVPIRNVKLVTSEKGVFSKDEINQYEVSIELASSYGRALPVRIVDQIPMTDQKDVEIRLVRTEPAAALAKDNGALEWRLQVPPSGKTRVSFTYSVKRPKGWVLHQ
jgi:hypothetical protein